MLPHADQAYVDIRKLRDYVLSVDSIRGKHKARVFRATLGVGPEEAEWLRGRILEGVRTAAASRKGANDFGVLYEADVAVQTDAGSATVRTGWIVLHAETFPRLTSCYVVT